MIKKKVENRQEIHIDRYRIYFLNVNKRNHVEIAILREKFTCYRTIFTQLQTSTML